MTDCGMMVAVDRMRLAASRGLVLAILGLMIGVLVYTFGDEPEYHLAGVIGLVVASFLAGVCTTILVGARGLSDEDDQ